MFELKNVTDAFVQLKAFGVDPLADDGMRTLGDAAAAMDMDVKEAVLTLTGAMSNENERLKRFGITAAQAGDNVTFKWTQNGKALTKTVKKSGEEIRKFVLENFSSRFAGAMEKQSKIFNGMLSNISDNWTNFQARIGDKGFFDVVKTRMSGLLESFDEWDKDGTLDKWAERLSNVLTGAFNALDKFVTQSAAHLNYLAENWDTVKPMLIAVGLAFAAMAAAAFPVTAAILAISFAVDDLLTYLEGGDSKIGDFVKSFEEMKSIGDIVDHALTVALGAVVPGLVLSGNLSADGFSQGFSDGWFTFVGGVDAWIKDFLDKFTFGNLFDAGYNLVASFFNGINARLKSIPSGVARLLGIGEAAPVVVSTEPTQRVAGANMFGGASRSPSGGARSSEPDVGHMRGADRMGVAAIDLAASVAQFSANLAKTDQTTATEASQNDNSVDNRNQSVETTVNIEQHVSQPAEAPGALARASGDAAARGVNQRTQIEAEPAL